MKNVQLRLILLSTFSVLTMATGYAQQADNAIETAYAVKTDTIVIRKAVRTADGKPIASNEAPKVKVYKPVPLATEKNYYGDKHEYMNDFVHSYLKSHNKTLSVVQDRSKKYFPIIDQILTKNNIPKELKYLAVIESALNNNARSPVGAVGPWQFMTPTGRFMGLKINRSRDERKDWNKSTAAAAKYLSYLYEDLNDWLLVVAAYNSGPRPVLRAIQRTGSTNFWDIKPYLPRETQGHVLAFVATATIFENLSGYIGSEIPDVLDMRAPNDPAILDSLKKLKPKVIPFTQEELQNMAIIKTKDALSLELMALELGIDERLLNKWNKDYDLFLYGQSESQEYSLRLPKDKLDQFLLKREYLIQKSQQVFADQNM